MTSERKIAANRRNSRKSCGPRTAAGKAIASRNALRHGLAANSHISHKLSPRTEKLAKALVGNNNDPLLFDAALVVAGNEFALRDITAQRIAVVDRLRDVMSVALAKGDNTLVLGKALYGRMKGPEYADHCLGEWTEVPETPAEAEQEWVIDLEAASKLIKERDGYESLEEASRDLVRLERYYQRTWSRQKRAIRYFIETKLMSGEAPPVSSYSR